MSGSKITPLYGHTSPETAYVVEDYPYGFRMRCRIRYWLESGRSGTRFVSQTTNPKRGDTWNNPKKSVYALLAGAMFMDENAHVSFWSLNEYAKADDFAYFVSNFPEADLSRVQAFVQAKIKFTRATVDGRAVWYVNGVAQTPSEVDISRAEDELRHWEAINSRVNAITGAAGPIPSHTAGQTGSDH